MEFEKDLKVAETPIPGMLVLDLPVHGDARGWFKENWQREKMLRLGLPDRRWVQNNVSFNDRRGATRGVHAEPWDKLVSVAAGSVYGAWVDLRPGPNFGSTFACVVDPSVAVYVPRGVGNAYQALEDGTAYTYLVDAHWSAGAKKTYTFVNLADPALGIEWPIPLGEATVSDADRGHPPLADVRPMAPRRTLVTGCGGQLGRAVLAEARARGLAAWFDGCDRGEFDISDAAEYSKIDWSLYGAVVNCGAYTAVDEAEGPQGRAAAWAANAAGPALLARACAEHGIALVHVSTDYVFDGSCEVHLEDEPFSPLGAYGASKAAGDAAVAACPGHYILRSSWVIGDGGNFVRTMRALSDRCADPADALREVRVVDDQRGRPTFASDMARAAFWLLGYRGGDLEPSCPAEPGTYNCTGSGRVASWCDVAREIFELANANGGVVRPVSTAEYCADAEGPMAPRPRNSALDLSKLEATGFRTPDWEEGLRRYLASEPSEGGF